MRMTLAELRAIRPDLAAKLEAEGCCCETQAKPKTRSKGGKRPDLGFFVRSAMEANVIRYCKWLKEHNQILDWKYEEREFKFPIERGTRFYRTDITIYHLNNTTEYWEVKGWMDPKSKTRLNRMKKYFPEIKLILIGQHEYKAIAKHKELIPNWE